MRFFTYAILCYLTLGLQIGLSPFVRLGGAAPNLVLLAVIFISLNAPRQNALLGSFVLGLLQDMLTAHTLGVFAFSYGLIALVIAPSQTLMFRDHPLTQTAMTLGACVLLSVVMIIQQLIHNRFYPQQPQTDGLVQGRVTVLTLLCMTVLTTALAPFVLGALQRMRRWFGFRAPPRQRI